MRPASSLEAPPKPTRSAKDRQAGRSAARGLHCRALMPRPDDRSLPPALPECLLEICAHLESHRIDTAVQGDALLSALGRPEAATEPEPARDVAPPRRATAWALVCAAPPETLRRALPRAVSTAALGARFSLPTEAGPVDLLPLGDASIDAGLPRFGLSAHAIAWRPRNASWIDPVGGLAAWAASRLEPVSIASVDPFSEAPRRYWIAARLLAEHGLAPSAPLVEAARTAFDAAADALPLGAPARRELMRILAAPDPRTALAFLRESGVTPRVAPGANPIQEERVAALPPNPALRWAAWLRGSATGSAMVRFRVPHALSHRIQRVQSSHPLDKSFEPGRGASLRRQLARLSPEDLADLFVWRRLEIAAFPDENEARRIEGRLDRIEERIASLRDAESQTDAVQALAIDGGQIMAALGAGPGRHVGQALQHLARFVADHPEANEPAALEAELLQWARRETRLVD